MNHTLARTRGTQEEAVVDGPVPERAGLPRGHGIETQVSIQNATPSNTDSLRRMFSRSSSETIYHRFHMPYPRVPEQMLAFMLDADEHDAGALVAVANEE